jgi:hypothetical protein
MPRSLQQLSALVATVALVFGIVVLASGDGPFAYKVAGHTVSQPTVDGELEAIAQNDALRALVKQSGGQPMTQGKKASVTSSLAASWVGLRIAQEVAARDVARRRVKITADDRIVSHGFASQSIGGQEVFRTLPDSLQARLDRRWTAIAVIEREHADCPSGRYVSHILVKTETEAKALKRRLDNGADFANLARARSLDTGSASNGGRLGCRDDLEDLAEPFKTAADAQPLGEVSDPVKTEFGFHLILVSDEFFAPSPSDVTLAAIQRHARRTPVEVDPRYGTWDRKNGQVLPPGVASAAG